MAMDERFIHLLWKTKRFCNDAADGLCDCAKAVTITEPTDFTYSVPSHPLDSYMNDCHFETTLTLYPITEKQFQHALLIALILKECDVYVEQCESNDAIGVVGVDLKPHFFQCTQEGVSYNSALFKTDEELIDFLNKIV